MNVEILNRNNTMISTNSSSSCFNSNSSALLLLFHAAHQNKQKIFQHIFLALEDDTKSTNCPGRAGFAKARYEEFFLYLFIGEFAILRVLAP